MNLGDLHRVWEIKTLKRKPGEEEAKKFLQKIAKQVQPIMCKHKWRVKLLSEFCPNNPRLLGLNVGGGIHVKLRLRRPNRDWDFYPFDQVLDTMLHELCHNVHGPHNSSFYKLWDELRKECEELMSKGITGTGEGFDLPGRRLGGFSRQPPLSSLRQTALAAAENRARLGSLLPSGPKRLGGDSTIKNALSPVQAAAMAAERRLQDDIWCGSHCSEIAEDDGSADTLQDHLDTDQRAERSSVKDVSSGHPFGGNSHKRSHGQDKPKSNFVDLTISPVSGSAVNQDDKSLKRSCKSNNLIPSSSSSFVPVLNDDSPEKQGETSMWECKSCTLLNPPLAPICEACFTERPRDIGTKCKFWSCKFCTLENCVKLDKCSACDQWRYSHGPPISTPAPNAGT
ncbi:Zinc ion binding isoform 2 [Hibiscus syriacus]|uniref:Zinc ion binding isoform 2 n=1 Tax=Hibiscus syriacus TaxID=106335 RepID=A0A6A2XUJ2_HIBSY|nr:DNA-dependent metalloprotease WSS1-like [Hibiscus syriacus]KAE8679158.1 Zinc ion binding isoform 2 [Hibiscus syriacus]